jgi:ParB-like chromosome segregation protein Spo0J
MEIKQIPLLKIKPYSKNAKEHNDQQIENIAKSIKAFGFNQPIVLDKSNVIIVGHGRYFAAHKLNLKKAPCIYAKLSESKTKAYRLADNKLNESDWLIDLVKDEIREIAEDDRSLTFFDESIIEEVDEEVEEIDEEVDVNSLSDNKYVIKFEYDDNEIYLELMDKIQQKAKDLGVTKSELLKIWAENN